jgi:hypothetical protein
MIPRIAHFIWIGSPLQAWAQKNIDSFNQCNPDYEVRLHTDETYLDSWYEECWHRTENYVIRSDMLRYSVLRRFGGVYFDTDWFHLNALPIQPVDEKLYFGAFVGNTPFNAAMASMPNLSIFKTIADCFSKQRTLSYMSGSHALRRAKKSRSNCYALMNGNFSHDLRESVHIYCREHGIDLGEYYGRRDYSELTAVHLSAHGASTHDEQTQQAQYLENVLQSIYHN